ncbi:MAG TPA: M20/M25/M40 family metallo-hydrolase [Chthoniobacterales bacterium]
MHKDDGSIAIPGFYDDVLPLSDTDRLTWQDIPFGEKEILAATGSLKLSGESGYSALERIWAQPTAEINGITAGYQGPGSKTIVPAHASAKLSFRLVPRQKPEEIAARVRKYLTSICPHSVRLEITYDHGGEPYYLDPENPYTLVAREALTEVFGRPPALIRDGLSIPTVMLFRKILEVETLLIGLGLPDCNAHSPNETFPLAHLDYGSQLHQVLLAKLGNLGGAASR